MTAIIPLAIIFTLAACVPAKKTVEVASQDNSTYNLPPESMELSASPEPVPEVEAIPVPAVFASAETATVQPVKLPVAVNLVLLRGGIFQMGNNDGDRDEAPAHPVKIEPFYMGKYEVSQKEYAAIMGNNPSSFKGDNLPVENLSWYDAVEYCNRLSVKEGLEPAYQGEGENITCNFRASGYRLPTEAEWEYAAGNGQQKFLYAGSDNADDVGWYNANSNGQPNIIGSKIPNSFNLYDMSGNVAEWCWDIYGAYESGEQNNPAGVLSGKIRVTRGGGWGNSEWNLRVSARSYYAPTARNSSLGFRIVRSGK